MICSQRKGLFQNKITYYTRNTLDLWQISVSIDTILEILIGENNSYEWYFGSRLLVFLLQTFGDEKVVTLQSLRCTEYRFKQFCKFCIVALLFIFVNYLSLCKYLQYVK